VREVRKVREVGRWSVRRSTQAGIAVDQCNVASCVISGKYQPMLVIVTRLTRLLSPCQHHHASSNRAPPKHIHQHRQNDV